MSENRQEKTRFKIALWLIHARASNVFASIHFWIIASLFTALGYVYYGVLPAYHDVYVLLFFYPLLYSAIVFRLRGVIISGLVLLGILLPHTMIFSYTPTSLVITLLFAFFGLLVSGMGATLLNYLEIQLQAYQEILSLNEELNRSIDRLESTQKQLILSEKMNAIGQLAASVAHEINNPLAGVLVYSKLLSKKIGNDSFDKAEALSNLSKIDTAVSHCSRIIRGLLDFSRQSEPALKPVLISNVIDQTITLVGHQAEMKHIIVACEDSSDMTVMADAGQLQQVLVNLIVNAIQSMSDGGKLTIRSSLGDGMARISVQDTGCGITPENMVKLFAPFFTTKEPGKGVGLGLAVSYGIIERHGGKIDVQSEVGKGCTFTVYLPAIKND